MVVICIGILELHDYVTFQKLLKQYRTSDLNLDYGLLVFISYKNCISLAIKMTKQSNNVESDLDYGSPASILTIEMDFS